MPVRHPKTRLVSFRLSEPEYQALQNLCEARDASSLSDLVRATVRRVAHDGDSSHPRVAGTTRAERLLQPVAEDAGVQVEPDGDDWKAAIAKEVLKLGRKTDVLDREIRRLSLLITKR